MQSFVLGFPYSQKRRAKCQLINFIIGQAKLAIYLSRKNKMHQMSDCHVVPVLRNLLMSRVSLDFFSTKQWMTWILLLRSGAAKKLCAQSMMMI